MLVAMLPFIHVPSTATFSCQIWKRPLVPLYDQPFEALSSCPGPRWSPCTGVVSRCSAFPSTLFCKQSRRTLLWVTLRSNTKTITGDATFNSCPQSRLPHASRLGGPLSEVTMPDPSRHLFPLRRRAVFLRPCAYFRSSTSRSSRISPEHACRAFRRCKRFRPTHPLISAVPALLRVKPAGKRCQQLENSWSSPRLGE
jgi:hypothetical protein